MSQPLTPGQPSAVGSSRAAAAMVRLAAAAVLAASTAGALVPSARWLDGLAVALVVAAPLARVAAAGVAVAREHDWRFAAMAAALLAVVAGGALLA